MIGCSLSRRGFTLLEVLIAVAIFGIAIMMFSQVLFTAIEAQFEMKERHDYNADLRFVRRHLLSLSDEDELEDGGEITTLTSGVASWEVELEPTALPDVMEMKMIINFDNDEDDGQKEYINSVYVLRASLAGDDNDLLKEDWRDRLEELRDTRTR